MSRYIVKCNEYLLRFNNVTMRYSPDTLIMEDKNKAIIFTSDVSNVEFIIDLDYCSITNHDVDHMLMDISC